jgi:flagellar biosynthesis protein FliP
VTASLVSVLREGLPLALLLFVSVDGRRLLLDGLLRGYV